MERTGKFALDLGRRGVSCQSQTAEAHSAERGPAAKRRRQKGPPVTPLDAEDLYGASATRRRQMAVAPTAGIPKWVARSGSGNMDQPLRFALRSFNFEPHPNGRACALLCVCVKMGGGFGLLYALLAFQ